MNNLLHKYFALTHKLYIPGIGTFVAAEKPAVLDFANKEIFIPPHDITYKNETAFADKNFFNFLCSQMHTEEWKAIIVFNDFVSHIKNVITHEGSFTIPGIGTLSQQAPGQYNFSQIETGINLFSPVTAERVIRKNAEHAVMVGVQEKTSVQMQYEIELQATEDNAAKQKEKWWIPAVVLAAIGFAALVYYYLVLNK